MKKLYILISLLTVSLASQAQIAQWNFDASANAPSTGAGTVSLIGGTQENIQTGAGACNCPYVAGNPSTGKAYSIKTFPALGTASGTAGYEFSVSTLGQTGTISVSFDPRGSGTSSKWQGYQYSTDGTNFTTLSNNGGSLANAFSATPVSLTFPASCSNNANFKFRIVSIFDPATNDYAPVTAGYLVTGAWRIDNVSFTGGALSTNQNQIAGLKVFVSNKNLNVTSDNNELKSVAVYNILGKQVINTTTSGSPINVSELSSGIYIVKVIENGKTSTLKVVIQ